MIEQLILYTLAGIGAFTVAILLIGVLVYLGTGNARKNRE